MKLFITIGTTEGYIEKIFDVPENQFATYLGLEIEVDDPKIKGEIKRATIVRVPFSHHAPTRIHTICQMNSEDLLTIESL